MSMRYETICGTCGEEHLLSRTYNHNFVARHTSPAPQAQETPMHTFENTVQPALNALSLTSLKEMRTNIDARIRELEGVATGEPLSAEQFKEILTLHETNYTQRTVNLWTWHCACGLTETLYSWEQCADKTKSHWAEKIAHVLNPTQTAES